MSRTDRAIASMLATPNPVRMIGSAVWLYLTLLQTANHRGLVVRTRTRLAESLSVTEDLVDIYLTRLMQRRLIDIQSPPPYLVISLPGWAGSELRNATERPNSSEQSRQIVLDVPVSSSKLLAAAVKKKNGVGVLGEGESLLAELQREFPKADRVELQRDLDTHAAAIVRQALTRVRQTPSEQIRKSRLALFRYLLSKLSGERT